ncbi:MAG: sugar phosphate isomerase/epimerase [SAR202 cluster bacterium]|nr:sugar phosphate isomerase/epimerase [SAR202 cluster bacterium]
MKFKIGMYLDELGMPFREALPLARDIGAEYVWWGDRPVGKPITALAPAEIVAMGDAMARNGLKPLFVRAGNALSATELAGLYAGPLEKNEAFRRDFDSIKASAGVAKKIGAGAICTFGFHWPGEAAGKATWPMRWATRGGVISDADMEKLYEAFSRVCELAETSDLDVVVVFQMSWNYTNTTGNFRRVAERVGSKRLKMMYNPADSVNSGEADVLVRGFESIVPNVHSVHLKGVQVVDGPRGKYRYCPLEEGDVDFETVLRQVREHCPEAVISLATHFASPDGRPETAMRTNMEFVRRLIGKVEGEPRS